MKYPSSFLDTNKIKSIRRDAQKSYDKDEITAFYLVRPWSIYISLFLKKYTKISANSVTFVMMTLSFIFPLIMISFSNIDQVLLITPLLFYVLYSLDMIDGELARLRKKTSKLGEFYDASLWFTLPILFSLYVYKVCVFLNLPLIIFFLTLITVSFELFILVSQSLFSNDRSVLNFLQRNISIKGKLVLFIKFLLSKQNIYVLYPVLYYFIFGNNFNLSIGFYSLLLLSYNMYSFVKFYKVKNAIE